MSSGSGSTAAKKAIQVKYKKISFKDLEFDQGDDFFERGQFGDVKRARWNDKVVAIKCFTSADRKGGFSEELVCLSLLQPHEHIVVMHGACVSDHPFIVLEFAPMSLEKVLHNKGKKHYRYHAEHVMSWSRQIALALKYIHSKDMLHRDIKPSNVLLFKDGILLKLCDFGTAKKLEHTLTNAVGTIRYMAPEVIRGRYYTDSCDAFSFGVVVWEMITRKRPTLGDGKGQHNNMAILYAMANGQRPPKIANIPKALSEMIAKCWDNEPRSRPTMEVLHQKLERLCQYVDEARPLVSKRQQRQKQTQGDTFASSRSSTQHENPEYKKEEEKEVEAGGSSGVHEEKEVSPMPAPKPEKLPPQVPHPQEVADQFRDRAATDSEINRPIGLVGGATPGHPEVGVATEQPSPPRQQYMKQVSTPEMSRQPFSIHHPVQMSASGEFRPRDFSPAGRQVSEYGDFQGDISYGTESILKEQSERFASYETEAMKKKGPQTYGSSAIANPSSPYFIHGLEPDLQPVIPIEDHPESKEIYRQYRMVAEQIVRAKKEYETLLQESAKLDKEVEYDRQKLEANRGLTQQHQQLLRQKDQLVAELHEHQEKLNKLMTQNDQFNSN